jgi:hypothetical protein
MRLLLPGCVVACCAACAPKTEVPLHSRAGHAEHARAAGPHYLSEAQRNRAQNYWLPQNRLPPDAPVLPPSESLAAADSPHTH